MAIDPRISLGLNPLNTAQPLQIFNQVREQQRQAQFDPLRAQQMQQQVQQGQQTLDLNQLGIESEKDKQDLLSVANFSKLNRGLFDSDDVSGVVNSIMQRKQQLQSQGRDTSQTDEMIQILNERGLDGLNQKLLATEQVAQQSGLLGRPQQGTASQRDFDTYKSLQAKAEQTGLEKDASDAEQFGRQAGFVRPTEQEKADISVDKTVRSEVEKGNAKRLQGFADNGIEAADSVANLKRSIALLDEVSTGGFDGALIKAKQLFGIEGADEGELSANLGKAVLAQLKPIFGAAFTAAEGERLERIEARLGANTETNKRLLGEALRVSERAAKRGMLAAEKLGDEFAAEEIRTSLSTKIEIPEVETDTQVSQPKVLRFDAQGNLINGN